ncbi:hypothetical protein ACFLWS_00345 [Chloroflexota bacterium]
MASDNNTERKFSEYLDKLLKGEDVDIGGDASDDLKEAIEFSRKLMALGSEPMPAFKSDLKKRLISKLVEREQRVQGVRRWWQFEFDARWLSVAAIAAVIILAIVGFLGYKSIFYQPPATTVPSKPTTPPPPTISMPPTAPTAPISPKEMPTESARVPSSPQPPLRAGGSDSSNYTFGFDNLSDLTAFSDMIAVVVIDRTVSVEQQYKTPYSTQWALRVEKVLKGPQFGQLLISQMGSSDVPGSDPSDDPLFLPGERYLLFLREYAPGKYGSFGPWGRYLIWNDKVYSMNHIIVGGGGYEAPPELNFVGLSLNNMVSNVVRIVDSVQLIFTQGEPRLKADVLRYPAGTTLTIDARLSSGEHGPAMVTIAIDKSGIPAALQVSLQPAEFVAYPRSVYQSTLTITMAQNLAPGDYLIPVEYDFEGVGRVPRVITIHVEPR